MAYVTVTELKRYLGIDGDNVADDALLSDMVQRAQAVIESRTGRTFEAATDTTRHHGADCIDGYRLWLDGDLVSVTSIVNGDGAAVATDQVMTQPRNRRPAHALVLASTAGVQWDADSGDIAVTGRWAYSLTPPADIVQATVRLAAWLYRQKDNVGADAPMLAGDTMILPSRLPADVTELLQPYRQVHV